MLVSLKDITDQGAVIFMDIKKILTLAVLNPSLFAEKLRDKLRYSMSRFPDGTCEILLDGVKFDCDFEMGSAARQMYLQIYEKAEVKLLKKILKPGGTFIDVGANIGYISAQAAASVGKNGKIHAFEPTPCYFEKLRNLQKNNPDYAFFVNNAAIGEHEGLLNIDVNLQNIGWNTLVPGFMPEKDRAQTFEVKVIRLDEYIEDNKVDDISLIKIDTEGYEFSVLKSMSAFFGKNPDKRPPLIVEICPIACPLQGYALSDIEDYMQKYSYKTYSVTTGARVNLSDLQTTTDVLFSA